MRTAVLPGNPHAQGMSILGMIHNQEVNVFIDSGAEGRKSNLINMATVRRLGLSVPGNTTLITFGDGRTSTTLGTVQVRLLLKAIHGTLRQTLERTIIDMTPDHEIIQP